MNNNERPVEQQDRIMQKMQALIKSDSQLALLIPSPAVGEAICAPDLSLAETMDRAFTGYADREALGSRDYDIVWSPEYELHSRAYKPKFNTISYAQLQSRIHAIANVWKDHPDYYVKPDERVCIFGFTSAEFTTLDFATAYVQAITVPMQTGTSQQTIDQIFETIRPATVAVTAKNLVSMAEHVAGKSYIRNLIVFEYDERDSNDQAAFLAAKAILEDERASANFISLQDLVALAKRSGWTHLAPHPDGGDRVASIVHSSGSSGTPKAAMVSEKAIRYYWTSIVENGPPIVALCLAPFSHLLGKGTLVSVLKHGGTAYFTLAPDMSTLFDDIRIARPTFVGFFPRIIELIYQHYQNEVARRLRMGESDGTSDQTVREQVKRELGQSYLGDRLCFALFGGSQMSAEVRSFFSDCFDVQLMDAYGNTEGGQVAVNGFVQRPPVLDYRLRDVPELGYYTSDKPYPRGEFCFKSIQSISGYYKAPEASEKLFDEDGFICTGDIVEEYETDHIAIIDRRNDVLKLSQGEYVPIGSLGPIFEGASDVISQIYIYGNSQRAYLLAVIVPNSTVVETYLGDKPSADAVRALIHQELHRVAKEEGIKSFEIPKDFIVEWELFSEENGLLSGLRKKLRPALERKYGERLEAIYESQEDASKAKRRELIEDKDSLSVPEILSKLLEIDLNIHVASSTMSSTFYELGGDSLGAVLFSQSLEEVFGVEVAADMILSPTGNLAKWSAYIQKSLLGKSERPNFASIHGKGATRITREDLDLTHFIAPAILNSSRELSAPPGQESTVLLTGANGFLGRFVCLAWLEKLALTGGKLVCLIRAADNTSAKARLDSAYSGQDPQLESRYQTLAAKHLEVIAADVGEEKMGLSDADYQRLLRNVDRVVHVAALVNHRFSYANLFGANVLGTAEVIKFSLLEHKKNIDFISTVAVYSLLDTSEVSSEESPLLDSIALSDDYASGYAASKWACEQLLQNANQHCGLGINVFRGDMMLPHQHYIGQANTADIFVRLIFSIIHTGLAPYSFFPLQEGGGKRQGHYDGVPVDVVAAAVVGAQGKPGEYQTFNIENYHSDDGCSLDAFVDWIDVEGYPIKRVRDYREWFDTFKAAHLNLSEAQRGHSALDVLSAFSAPQALANELMQCDRFKRLVADLLGESGLPHLSQNYIRKCLRDMNALGLIDVPAANNYKVV
ncbi:thioester reductase domain-containing protein [Zhongshania aquimaris]|nr:thioester reductase domain-containing protein [Zhongshania aquimaris]